MRRWIAPAVAGEVAYLQELTRHEASFLQCVPAAQNRRMARGSTSAQISHYVLRECRPAGWHAAQHLDADAVPEDGLGVLWDEGHRASVELKANRAYFETEGGLVSADDDHPGICLSFTLTTLISSRIPFAAEPRGQKVVCGRLSLVTCRLR